MNTVKDLLAFKGAELWTVAPDDTVYDALMLMEDKDIGAVLVMDGAELVGILSERDYARKVVLRGRSSRETLVRSIMTTDIVTVTPFSSIRECMELMSREDIRHLPVMVDGQVVGVISISDVMREIIYEQGETIRFWQDLSLEG